MAARGWNVFRKTVSQSSRKGDKLTAAKQENKEALEIDPCALHGC